MKQKDEDVEVDKNLHFKKSFYYDTNSIKYEIGR